MIHPLVDDLTALPGSVLPGAANGRAHSARQLKQQRFPDHYRDEGLKLPLALHLAGKATEYALPQEYAETWLLEDAPEAMLTWGWSADVTITAGPNVLAVICR